jgi:methionyl-tRNA formyltransferase
MSLFDVDTLDRIRENCLEMSDYDAPTTMNRLTKKDLAARWNRTTRTVERMVKAHPLIPAQFIGNQPVWNLADVIKMEAERTEKRLAALGYKSPTNGKILTVKEAKRLARGRQ